MSTSRFNPDSPSQRAAYADLFERLKDSTFLLDPNSYIILEANPACERILGVPADKLVGRSITQLVEESTRDAFNKALRVAMRRYHPRQFESQWSLNDGRRLTMDIMACPLKLADGQEVLQIVARDVSFRFKQEQKMQALLRELQSANAKLEVLTTVDEMTGLYNFRHFASQLQSEHERAARYGTPYTIIFCDLDHFKAYNDRNGHPAGDEVLRQFAAILQRCCRSTDFPTRYGGEEFAVICPNVTWEGAAVLAERIRSTFETAGFENSQYQPLGKLTVSIGVASYPVDGQKAEEVLKAADEATYASKSNGRNQVTSAAVLTAAAILRKPAA